jgi:putative oxidoreductase
MANNIALLIGRILLVAIFIMSGASKFNDGGMTAGMIAGAGLPAPQFLAYLSGAFEVLSGLAVLIGFQTKIVSYLLAAFCVFTGLVFHHGAINMPNFSPEANGMLTVFNQIMMMKDLAMAGGFLALAVAGAGALSVDGRRGA